MCFHNGHPVELLFLVRAATRKVRKGLPLPFSNQTETEEITPALWMVQPLFVEGMPYEDVFRDGDTLTLLHTKGH